MFNYESFSQFLQEVQTYHSVTTINIEEIELFLKKFTIKLNDFPKQEEINEYFKEMASKNKLIRKKWNLKEKILMLWIVYHYTKMNKLPLQMEKNNAESIAKLLNKNPIDMIFKYHKMEVLQPSKTKKWSTDEDALLSEIVRQKKLIKDSKFKWIDVAKEYEIRSEFHDFRNEKSCRQHWLSHLNPRLNKTTWSHDEEMTLFQEYLKNPNKWIAISKSLIGRDCYSVKNHFEGLCSRYNLDKTSEDLITKLIEILKTDSIQRKITHLNEPIKEMITPKYIHFPMQQACRNIGYSNQINQIPTNNFNHMMPVMYIRPMMTYSIGTLNIPIKYPCLGGPQYTQYNQFC